MNLRPLPKIKFAMESRNSINWLVELSKKREYSPEIVGSDYQPLGTRWEPECAKFDFSDRELHRGVYFNKGGIGVVLVAGGWSKSRKARCSDIYESSGFEPEYKKVRSSSEWSPRVHFSMFSSRNGKRLYIIGGDDGAVRSDVWLSRDYGKSFICRTELAPWGARLGFASTLVGENQLVLCGGRKPGGEVLQDVWVSDDGGRTWKCVSEKCGWKKRSEAGLVVWKNELLLVGGRNEVGALDDVWTSKDRGVSWKKKSIRTPWKARHSFTLICDPVSSELIILGGTDSEGHDLSDVWASVDGGVSWMARGQTPGQAAVVATDEGSLVAVGRRVKRSDSDLQFVKKDRLFVMEVGARSVLPIELWEESVVPFAIDVGQLSKRN